MSADARTLRPAAWAAWLGLTLLATAAARAIGSRWHIGHVWPEPACVACAFFALHFARPISLGFALLVGLDAGAAAFAPLGVVEGSYVWATLAIASVRGRWLGAGARSLAAAALGWRLAQQVVLVVALGLARRPIGFASVGAATGVWGGLLDAALAFLCWPLLDGLARALAPMPPKALVQKGR